MRFRSFRRIRAGTVVLTVAGLVMAAVASTAHASPQGQPWLNPGLSPEKRATALLDAMTLTDKVNMLHGVSTSASPVPAVGYIPPIPALGVPGITMTDGPAGVRNGQKATEMPSPIAEGASFDPNVAYAYGSVVGGDARALGQDQLFGPGMNIGRIPTNGRNFEYFSEDPVLSGTIAGGNVRGVQSQGVIATIKHYVANNQETNRTTISANVDDRTLHEIYENNFGIAVATGHPGSVMCSYNRINDIYSCENPSTLDTALRAELGFNGFVVSDYPATHAVTDVNAGLNVELPTGVYFTLPSIQAALANGSITMATINKRVYETLVVLFRFGLFDRNPQATSPIDQTFDNAVAQSVEEQSAVLLKNAQQVLPLGPSTTSMAIIGSTAKTSAQGGGSSQVNPLSVDNAFDALVSRAGVGTKVSYDDGSNTATAATTAAAANIAVVFVRDRESEGSDRTNLSLPNNQDALVSAVAAANPNTIVVLETGGPVLAPWLSSVKGVLEAWYPGARGGAAIARLLYGDVNPSGHLQQTWPATGTQVPASTPQQYPGVNGEETYSERLNVGYRWYDANNQTPLFPFGYSLSYTSFAYSNLQLSTRNVANDVSGPFGGQSATLVTATAIVTNTGNRAGSDVAQLYLGDPASAGEPPLQLQGYQKVTLQPGQHTTVRFALTGHALSYFDTSANGWVVPDGDFTVNVGDSSALANLPLQRGFKVTRSIGARGATLSVPATVAPTASFTATATFANNGDYRLTNAEAILSAPAGWKVTPQGKVPSQVSPQQTITVSWTVTVPEAAQGTTATLEAELRGVTGSGKPATAFSATAQTAVSPLVTASAPAPLTVKPGSSATAIVTLTSQIPRPVTVQVNASAPAGISVTPAAQTVTASPTGTLVTLTVTVPSTTPGGVFPVSLTMTATDRGRTFVLPSTTFTVTVPFASLAAAFNNTGIANESNPASANFDGSGYSYSEQQLTSAGFAPGATFTHDAITYTWPSSPPGTPDNVVAEGQTIAVGGSGSRLGILAAANNGTAMGPVTVTYTDGTSTTAQVTVADWYANQAAPGGDILVTTPAWNALPPNGPHPVSIYATSVPIDPTKTVASVTLPPVSNGTASGVLALHIFALAAG